MLSDIISSDSVLLLSVLISFMYKNPLSQAALVVGKVRTKSIS